MGVVRENDPDLRILGHPTEDRVRHRGVPANQILEQELVPDPAHVALEVGGLLGVHVTDDVVALQHLGELGEKRADVAAAVRHLANRDRPGVGPEMRLDHARRETAADAHQQVGTNPIQLEAREQLGK